LKRNGFTLSETLVALAIGGLLVLVAVPAFLNMIKVSRLRAAARQTVGDLREARAQAIATGWECKIVGFGAASGDPNRNRYRIVARQTSAVAWPADTSPVFKSVTQRADPWMDVGSAFPGVQLDPGGSSTNDRFEIVFDSRGAATASVNDFNPFRVVGNGKPAVITVSPPGGIILQ
jgi:prepilin-type N-terminal cleavage/methylation domain-containing protein